MTLTSSYPLKIFSGLLLMPWGLLTTLRWTNRAQMSIQTFKVILRLQSMALSLLHRNVGRYSIRIPDATTKWEFMQVALVTNCVARNNLNPTLNSLTNTISLLTLIGSDSISVRGNTNYGNHRNQLTLFVNWEMMPKMLHETNLVVTCSHTIWVWKILVENVVDNRIFLDNNEYIKSREPIN